ncbi:hypothetical protein H0A58_04740 [Alcaligenaceae bacterium]|nr:hypothetical protein [Alcaligenaceae bacterium]
MTPLEMLTPVVHPTAAFTQAERQADPDKTHATPPSSTRVSISAPGQTLSKAGGTNNRYQDIDDSDLPDVIKHLLRMIRDLRQALNKLAQELQQIQADSSISAEAKRTRLLQVQAQMSAVNGSLMQATQKLASMIRDSNLDSAQQMTAGHLALR